MRWIAFTPALFALALTGAASAASIDEFEVAGMRLGMSVAEIEKAAAARGLPEEHRSPGPTFEQQVVIDRGELLPGQDYAAVRSLRYLYDTEQVDVEFVSMPDGERAFRITQKMLDSSLKTDEVGAQIETEYGAPDKKYENMWVWGDTQRYSTRRSAPFLEYAIRPMSYSKSMKRPVAELMLEDPSMPKQVKAAVQAQR